MQPDKTQKMMHTVKVTAIRDTVTLMRLGCLAVGKSGGREEEGKEEGGREEGEGEEGEEEEGEGIEGDVEEGDGEEGEGEGEEEEREIKGEGEGDETEREEEEGGVCGSPVGDGVPVNRGITELKRDITDAESDTYEDGGWVDMVKVGRVGASDGRSEGECVMTSSEFRCDVKSSDGVAMGLRELRVCSIDVGVISMLAPV